ncbi:hypothetical protein [Pseudoalteromonas sp. GB56]
MSFKNRLAITLLLATLSMSAFYTFACSCRDVTVQEATEYADAVVIATAVNIEHVLSPNERFDPQTKKTFFTVLEVFKGQEMSELQTQIDTVCCICGMSFTQGETYLLYLQGPDQEGFYHASTCSRSRGIKYAQEDLQILRK